MKTNKSTLILIPALLIGIAWRAPISSADNKKLPDNVSVGETLVFDVGWKAATAGNITIKVIEKKPRQSRVAYKLFLEARTNAAIDTIFKVRDKFESWFDADSKCSAGFMAGIEEGKYRKQTTVFINVKSGDYKMRTMWPNKKSLPTLSTGLYPRGVQDYLSALYYFRSLSFENGKTFPAQVAANTDVFDIALRIKGTETIKVPAGSFSCFATELLLKTDKGYESHPQGRLFIWFSADAKKIPIQIVAEPSFGRLEVKLASY